MASQQPLIQLTPERRHDALAEAACPRVDEKLEEPVEERQEKKDCAQGEQMRDLFGGQIPVYSFAHAARADSFIDDVFGQIKGGVEERKRRQSQEDDANLLWGAARPDVTVEAGRHRCPQATDTARKSPAIAR